MNTDTYCDMHQPLVEPHFDAKAEHEADLEYESSQDFATWERDGDTGPEMGGRNRMNAFHRWLLKNRPYCELCSGPYPSTRIIEINNKNVAVCDAHFQSHHPLQTGYERRVELYYKNK